MVKMNESISGNQAFCMIALFIIGSATLMATGISAKLDVWLSILLALLISTILFFLYSKILNLLPEKDFFETLEILLGKPLTIIFVLFLTWFSFDLGQIVLNNYSQFIKTIGLSDTPFIVITLSMVLLCAITIKFGFEVIARWSQLFIIPVVAFLIVAIFAAINYVNLADLQPIMYDGFMPVLNGAIGVTSFPFAETVVFFLVFPAFKKNISIYRTYLSGLYLAGILLLIVSVIGLLTFGTEYISALTYPIYEVLSVFKIGTFITRMEILGAAVFCLAIFFKITILLCATCKGLAYSLNVKNYHLFAFPIALMMANFNLFSTASIAAYQDWVITVWPLYSAVFEIIIPIIIIILLEVQYRRFKNNKRRKKENE